MTKRQRAFDALEAEETLEDLVDERRPHGNASVGQIKMMLQTGEVRDDGTVSKLREGKQVNNVAFEERIECRLDNGNRQDDFNQIEEGVKPANTNVVGSARTACNRLLAGAVSNDVKDVINGGVTKNWVKFSEFKKTFREIASASMLDLV